MASGGVASPTDKLTSTQFTEAELMAIVGEAEACGAYVCAHAYTAKAIARAVNCGVRSIEHGNLLDQVRVKESGAELGLGPLEDGLSSVASSSALLPMQPTARLMRQKGCFLVPTLVTYQALKDHGLEAGMPSELVKKASTGGRDAAAAGPARACTRKRACSPNAGGRPGGAGPRVPGGGPG